MRWAIVLLGVMGCRSPEDDVPPRMEATGFYVKSPERGLPASLLARDVVVGASGGAGPTLTP